MAQMTNEEFGRRVGVSHGMASRLRSGDRRPSVQTMRRIHVEFGIPVEELMAAHDKGPQATGKLIRARLKQLEKQQAQAA